MDTPLYKLYLYKRGPKFFDLSAEQLTGLRSEMQSIQKSLGIRDLFNAQMAWSNEQYEFFGVEYYPSLASVQEYSRALTDMNWYQYIQSETFLGIPMDASYPDYTLEPLPADARPVYRVYLSKPTPVSRVIPQDELDEAYACTEEASRLTGAKTLLSAYVRWNNEGWEYFGVERFPSLESVIGFTQHLTNSGWYRLVESRSYLGTCYSGLMSGFNGEQKQCQ